MPSFGRPPKYPWDDWFALPAIGDSRTLVHGTHFHTDPRNFRKQVAAAATSRGVLIRTEVEMTDKSIKLVRHDGSHVAYPWAKLLDGGSHVLQRRRDYWVTPESMATQVHHMAKMRGVTVRVGTSGDRVFINPPQPKADVRFTKAMRIAEDFFQAYAQHEEAGL